MAKAVHVTYGNQRRSIVIHTRMTLNELLSLLHATFSIPKSNPDMIQGLRYRDQDTIVPLDYVIRLAEQMPSEMDLVVSTPTSTSTSTSTSTTTSRLRPYSCPSTASSSQPSSATSTTSFGNGITAVRSATNKNKHIKLSNGDDFSAPRPSSKIDALASTIASLDPASRASLLSKLGVPSENTRINTARTVSSTDHLLPRRRTRTPSLGDDDTGTRSTPHKKIRKSTSFSNDINTPFFYSEATRFTLPTVHSGRRSSMSRYRSPAWSGAIQQPSTSTSTSTPSSQQLFTAGSNGYYQPQPVPTPTINGPFGASQRNLRRTTSQSSSTSRAPPSLIHAPSIDPDNHRGTVLLRSYTELLEQLASAEERMVVLAIYARGSKPCREISSVFDRMAASGHFPDLIFAEIDAEYLKYTALQVEAVPTFHFYMAEHILAQLVGPSADELEKVIVSSEALVHAQLASSAARAQYDSDSDTSAMGTKGPTIYDESDVENEYEIRPRSDSLASSVTPSELDTWGDLKSDSDISEYDTEDDYQYTQQRKLKKLLKQRARLQRHVQQIQQIEESLEEPEDDDEWMSSRQAQHYRTLPGDESDMDETRSRRDSILDDTEIDENYFAPPSPSRPLITSDEAAIIEKLILRQDPRVDLAYRAVPELSKVIDAFMRLAQSVRNSPTHASTSTSTSAVKSAPASTRHRNDSMPSDVERWYEKEHEIQPTTSSYHEKNCTVLNDILVQLYNDGEISRSHIVLLHALGQQSDGSIHDALLQYHIDGDKMILIRKLKDVACNTDPNKINFNLGHDVEKATPRRDVATSTTTRAQDASTSTHRNVATTTKTRGRDQSTSTSTPTTTRGTSTIRPRQVNAQTSTSSRITRATNTTPGSKTKSTSTSPTKIPTVPDSPLDAVSQHKLSELRDHLSRLESFLRRDLITKDEALQLARWMQEGQPLIQAALMAYTFNQDEMDLLDSFLRILRKKHIMSQQTTPASNTKSHIRRFSSQPFDESIDVDESDEADEMTNELIWSSALSSMDLLMRFVRAVPMEITKEQRETLAKMVSSQDPVILAAFELYKETDKMDEFVDTLYRLVKQEKKSTTTSAKTTSPKKTTSSTTTSSTDKSSSTTAQDNMKNHDEVKQELQIMGVLERGNVFDADQAAYLRQLILSRDDCIMAAFDLAKQDEQWDEMHDTLSRLIARRRPDLGIEMNTARTHTSQPDIDENDEDDDDEKDASFNINRFQKLFANVVEAMTDATTLTHQQAIWLCKAFVARHPLIQAALEVYSLDEDVEELQDSLRVIAVENVKAQTQPSQPQQQNGDEDEDEEEEEDQDDDDDDDDDEDEEDQEEDQDDEETTLSHHGLGNSYGTLHDVDEDDDDDDEDVDGLANGIRAVDWGDQPYEEINGGDEE